MGGKGRLQHFSFLISLPHVPQHILTSSARGLSHFSASKPGLVSDWLSRKKANIEFEEGHKSQNKLGWYWPANPSLLF